MDNLGRLNHGLGFHGFDDARGSESNERQSLKLTLMILAVLIHYKRSPNRVVIFRLSREHHVIHCISN
jgi:hypothetical protein